MREIPPNKTLFLARPIPFKTSKSAPLYPISFNLAVETETPEAILINAFRELV